MLEEVEYHVKKADYATALSCLKQLDSEAVHTDRYIKLLAHTAFRCNDFALAQKSYDTIFTKKIQDLRAYLEYAKILMNNKEFAKAREYLEEGLTTFPHNTSMLRSLIAIAKQEKSIEYELLLCNQLLDIDHDNKISYKLLLDALLRSDKSEQIEPVLNKARLKFGEHEFLLESIKYFTSKNEFETVLEQYIKLQAIDPSNYIVYIGILRTLDALNRFVDAKVYLLKGLDLVEKREKILEALVNYYLRTNHYEQAIKYAKELIKEDSENIKHYIKLVHIFIKCQAYKKAFAAIVEVEKRVADTQAELKDLFLIHCAKALLYQEVQSYKRAIEELDLALDLYPDDAETNLQFGIVKMKLFQFERAKSVFKHIIAIHPNFKKAQTYLIALTKDEQSRKKSMELYNNLIENSPKNRSDYCVYIDLIMAFGNTEKAMNISKRALEKSSFNVQIHSRLIALLLEKGDIEDAIRHLNNILETEQFHIELFYLLRCLEKYTFLNRSIDMLHTRILEAIKKSIVSSKSNSSKVKNIAILGGSNSIMRDGWAVEFKKTLSQLTDISVKNYGLGGISSLYGLFIAKEKALFKNYDIIIFEYTLNDIFFDYYGGYDYKMLASVLLELINEADKYGVSIVFMLMSPLDNAAKLKNKQCKISSIYRNIAHSAPNAYVFDVYSMIESKKFSSENFISMLYRDNTHYSATFAKEISDRFIKEFLTAMLFSKAELLPHSVDHNSYIDLSQMMLLKPESYQIHGTSHSIVRESTIVSFTFMVIKKGGSIEVTIARGKRVLALLINSSEHTGYIKVAFNQDTFLKNIFAERPINDQHKARIYLKQFTKELVNYDDEALLHLSVGVTQQEIQTLQIDTTVYEEVPQVSLSTQELEIAGVLIA